MQLSVVEAFVNRVLVGVVEIEETAHASRGKIYHPFRLRSRGKWFPTTSQCRIPQSAPSGSARTAADPFAECESGR